MDEKREWYTRKPLTAEAEAQRVKAKVRFLAPTKDFESFVSSKFEETPHGRGRGSARESQGLLLISFKDIRLSVRSLASVEQGVTNRLETESLARSGVLSQRSPV